jgi:tetratricopeptide (TPR) repeat protein
VLAVAVEVLAGELDAARGQVDDAVAHLERGAAMEDSLCYSEPAEWYYLVRHSLGAVLLSSGRAAEAEQVYLTDLRRNPENGWALYGLMLGLDTQGRSPETQAVRQRFDRAWAHADVTPSSSRG